MGEEFKIEIFIGLLSVGTMAVVCTSNWFKIWWENHVCGWCEHPSECFECNQPNEVCNTDASKCELMRKQN